VLHLPHTRREHRIDWPGALALIVALVPLLIVAEQGRTWGWASTNSIVSYVIGGVGLILFVLCERWYGDDALLPLRLFRNSVFSLVTVVGIIVGMGMFGGIAVLPQFLQIVRGASPIQSGFLMLPLVAGIMVASVTSGQLTSRTGRYKVFPVVGTLLMTAALVIMSMRINVDIPFWELDLYMAMFGLGLGCCMQTLILAAQNASPARDMGVVTASSTFFRQLGGTIGTAVSSRSCSRRCPTRSRAHWARPHRATLRSRPRWPTPPCRRTRPTSRSSHWHRAPAAAAPTC
jgi:predicted MFS family arabinose efflux permease